MLLKLKFFKKKSFPTKRFKNFEIKNKDTILSEIDKTLGRNKPPAIEYIYVNPVQSFKFRFHKLFTSDSSQNP